jgi:hypothetical protein
MVAMQLLRRNLLDVPLFMNTFAKTFLRLYEALRVVNAEVKTAPTRNIERLNSFKEMCEKWLREHPEDAETRPRRKRERRGTTDSTR